MAAPSIEDILAQSGLINIFGEFALMRQDTHGCEYFMFGNLSQEAADYLAKHYTRLGHHQSYWSEIPKDKSNQILPPVPLR